MYSHSTEIISMKCKLAFKVSDRIRCQRRGVVVPDGNVVALGWPVFCTFLILFILVGFQGR